jgi:type II secretion system protein N
MKRVRNYLILVFVGFLGLFLFVVTVIILIPDKVIENMIRDNMEQNVSLTFTTEGFKKMLPFGFEAYHISISPLWAKEQKIYFDKIRGNIKPLRIFLGEVRVTLDGDIANGKIASIASLGRKKTNLKIKIEGLNAAVLSPLNAIGLTGTGTLSGEGTLEIFKNYRCPNGSLNIEGKDIYLKDLKIGNPSLLFGDRVNFSLNLNLSTDCRTIIKGLWIEGKELAARLYGDIFVNKPLLKSKLALTMEILPGKGYHGKQGLLSLLGKYRKSSNYYTMNIKGSVQRPLLVQ